MKNKVEIFYAILSGTASPEEELLFQELKGQKDNLVLFNQLKQIWNESGEVKSFKSYDPKRAFYALTQKLEHKRQIKRRYLLVAASGIAAGIILMIGLFCLVIPPGSNQHQASVVFETEAGNRSVIVLPDSSKVWLNAKTQIHYDADFGKTSRNIYLSGEGFFEVTHGRKPFIVNAGDFRIQVYGTKFNVSAYDDDPVISTCLEAGKISIKRKGTKELFVEPGQLIAYNKVSSVFSLNKVNPEEYSGWRSNKMYLHNEPLESLAKKLERKYCITIAFIPEKLGSEVHYSGIFSNENAEEVLDAIAIASGLKYVKKSSHYTVSYR
jgi:transmembrane sensor